MNPSSSAFITLAGLALAALCGGCRTAPTVEIPVPLPETLPWNQAGGLAEGGAFLGLETHENDSGSLDELFFDAGIVVERVVVNSPAAAAGFKPGDVVLEFAGEAVNDPGALAALLHAAQPGEVAKIGVRRGDTVQQVEVALTARAGERRAEPEFLYRLDAHRSRAGWATDVGGVRLVSANDESPFPEAGVPVGSLVLAIEGVPARSDRALIRQLATYPPGTRVEAHVRLPDQSNRKVDVRLQTEQRRITEVSVPILFTYRSAPGGETTNFVLLDFWIISLVRYARTGAERTTRILRWFSFSSGIGELDGQ